MMFEEGKGEQITHPTTPTCKSNFHFNDEINKLAYAILF